MKNASRSSENVASEIGLTPNGLRKTIKNETLTLAVYEKLSLVLKVHPAFVFDKEGDPSDYSFKKNPSEVHISSKEVQKLQQEIKTLKELNMKLQSRLIDLLDERKKTRN